MPKIKPSSVKDLLDIIDKHRSDIENGTYDIILEEDWTSQIPHDVSLFLLKHSHGSRLCLGQYSNDATMLSLLSRDSFSLVRAKIAKNTHTPPELLTILAKDEEAGVRAAVAENPNTPISVLTLLSKDLKDLKDLNGLVLYKVADNLHTPPEVLSILAKNDNNGIRDHVARNPNTPTSVLTLLSKDSDRSVCIGVANNIHTPTEVLSTLASNKQHCDVRLAVAFNPNTPISVRDALIVALIKQHPNMRRYIEIRRKKECFIATAIYGSHAAPEVAILRNYRNNVLMKNSSGRLCVIIYYFVSPTIARFIRHNGFIKYIIRRFILAPLLCRIQREKDTGDVRMTKEESVKKNLDLHSEQSRIDVICF